MVNVGEPRRAGSITVEKKFLSVASTTHRTLKPAYRRGFRGKASWLTAVHTLARVSRALAADETLRNHPR